MANLTDTLVNGSLRVTGKIYGNVPTAPAGTSTEQIASTAFVTTAIDNLPEPMIFKGSLGTGGTITTLPAAAKANEGFTYKVITAGTYASKAAKVGDTFISTGSAWELIPSGDEPSGTVTSVGLTGAGPITVTGSPITSSGTLALSFGTTAIANGGTGATTVKNAEYNLNVAGATALNGDPIDTYRLLYASTSPSTTNGVIAGYRTVSTMWNYIKGKLSSDTGVNISGSAASCTGNAATASAAKSGSALETAINGKVSANTAITSATKCKITYDTKGLVTAGADLAASDIPSLAASKITSGTFDVARIPDLSAAKITSGNLDVNRLEKYSIAYHRIPSRDSTKDGKQWTRIAYQTISTYPTKSNWGAADAVLEFYQTSYSGTNLCNIGRLSIESHWGHNDVAEGGTPYSFKTSGTKAARWNNYNPTTISSVNYGTDNDGHIVVKVVCTDDTIEWWLANCIWDTEVTYFVRFKSNLNLYGDTTSGASIKTNDEFNEYIKDKAVTNMTFGDGSVAYAANNLSTTLMANLETTFVPENDCTWSGPAYVSGDTHFLYIGQVQIDSAFRHTNLLISSSFWGNQHGGAEIISIRGSNNVNIGTSIATARPQVTVSKTTLNGDTSNPRKFYWQYASESLINLYVYVTGGNSYGNWMLRRLGGNCDIKSKLKWTPNYAKPSTTKTTATWTSSKYITTNVSTGAVVDLNGVADGSWQCTVFDVSPGDEIYAITLTGGTSPRAWAFLDSNNKLISKCATAGQSLTNATAIAPVGAVKCVLNNAKSAVASPVAKYRHAAWNEIGYNQSHVGIADIASSASSVAWSGVTGTPTTVAGYGITDAITDVSGKLDKTGGDMTGNITMSTASAAYNSVGLKWSTGSFIGTDNTNGLGLYATKLYLRPGSAQGTSSGKGLVISETDLTYNGGGFEIQGTSSVSSYANGGGAFHNGYANLLLRGNATTGVSGIVFTSSKGTTSVNQPSDKAFIQYHPMGVTTLSAEGNNPTLGTSGEANKLVIGVGNDSDDMVYIQAPAKTGIRHIAGTTNSIMLDSANYYGYVDTRILGQCDTAAATAAKTVTLPGYSLRKGSVIRIKVNIANTAASALSLNVNPGLTGNAAKTIKILTSNNTWTTTSATVYTLAAGSYDCYYDGTNWLMMPTSSNVATISSNIAVLAGQATYATKNVFAEGFQLVSGESFKLYVDTDNTSATALNLNVNNTGAKPLYIDRTKTSTTNYTLNTGWYTVYYDGANYQLCANTGTAYWRPISVNSESKMSTYAGTTLDFKNGANTTVEYESGGHITINVASAPASDVSAWAKESSKPSYTATEVTCTAAKYGGSSNVSTTQAALDALSTAVGGKQATLATQTVYTAKGSATKVPQITTNSLGQVTGITEVTITDSKQNVTLNNNKKAYITGINADTAPTSTATGRSDGIADTGVYFTTTAGQLNATSYKVAEKATMQFNTTDNCVEFVF